MAREDTGRFLEGPDGDLRSSFPREPPAVRWARAHQPLPALSNGGPAPIGRATPRRMQRLVPWRCAGPSQWHLAMGRPCAAASGSKFQRRGLGAQGGDGSGPSEGSEVPAQGSAPPLPRLQAPAPLPVGRSPAARLRRGKLARPTRRLGAKAGAAPGVGLRRAGFHSLLRRPCAGEAVFVDGPHDLLAVAGGYPSSRCGEECSSSHRSARAFAMCQLPMLSRGWQVDPLAVAVAR